MARRRAVPLTPALIDGRVLAVAALLVAPAAWQASQGLLSVDQVLTRYLLVALGCSLALALVRTVWPVLAGAPADGAEDGAGDAEDSGGAGEASAADPVAASDVSPPPG